MVEKSACVSCGGMIEFDMENFVPGVVVDCPHCGQKTALHTPKEAQVAKEILRTMLETKKPDRPKKKSSTVLAVAAALFFIVGLGLTINGCIEDLDETDSAVRQTVFTLQYGFGLIVILLSLILNALARLISEG